MDTLRNALEIVFKEMMVGPLLKDAPRSPCFDAERFARILQRHSPDLSLDQCRLSARMVEQYYMMPPDGAAGRNCGSVFNILLHFSRAVLREYEGRPVCKFEHLLRWNAISSLIGEDLLTSSFLACKDLRNNYKRNDFDWGLVIDQDDPDLRELFHNKMADVHMHLKGSSCNFDLNWLSLMNHPDGRGQEFRGLESLRHPLRIMNSTENVKFSLQALATKACAIRYLLYNKYVGIVPKSDEKSSLLVSVIKAGNDISTVMHTRKLAVYLATERLCTNPHRTGIDHDYIWQVDENAVKRNPNCILAGERRLLYECLRAVYYGEMTEYDCRLLHAYILIKNIIRNELIQTNDVVGFDNFNSYEIRKTLFIDNYPVYERLVAPLAIGQYFYKGLDRYVEPRIAPKDSVRNLLKAIDELDRDLKRMSLADKDRDYRYILHFIKQRDTCFAKSEPMNPRHHELRQHIRRQAYAIYGLCKHSRFSNRVAGIDAANSEINARPEVFAQAFRFLRDMRVRREDINTSSLGLTYHVGEDFLSIIDGLRAIDEVSHFLRFRRGDRLGHALVLCVDPERYLRSRHEALLLPKMLVLDDIAWALNKSEEGACLATLRAPLENIFYRVFREVYGVRPVSVRDYYESWLLRGDNPARYINTGNIDVDLSDKLSLWSRYDLNNDSEAVEARKNPEACKLYRSYHYDLSVRTSGEKTMELRCPEGTAQLIADLQKHVIRQIENRNIGIETNPTSNVRIGGFGRYIDHTAMKFLSIDGLQTHLSASINTDDRGVFATSLEREYALLACAIAKGDEGEPSRSMAEICAWLDRIRRNGLAQRF